MTDAKITALTAATTASETDILPFVESPGGSPATKKITVANLFAGRSGLATDKTWAAAGDLIVGTANDTAAILSIGADTGMKLVVASGTAKWIHDDFGINIILGDGVNVVTTGVKGYLEMPFDCLIESVTTLADVSGSIVIDVWKDTYANYPPTVADTITASAKPTLSSAIKAQDSTLTGWTKTVTKGDILGFNVDSSATVKQVTLSIKGRRTATA